MYFICLGNYSDEKYLVLATVAPVSETGFINRSQTQNDRVQNCGTFLCTVISESYHVKNIFFKSVTFQFHARMLFSEVAQSLKSYGHFSDLGVRIALSHRHVGFFG